MKGVRFIAIKDALASTGTNTFLAVARAIWLRDAQAVAGGRVGVFNTAGALAEFWIGADARAVWLRDPKVVAGAAVRVFNTARALAEFWIGADTRAVWLCNTQVVAGGRIVVLSACWTRCNRWVEADAFAGVGWVVVTIFRAVFNRGCCSCGG